MHEFSHDLEDFELNLEMNWQALEPILSALTRSKPFAKLVKQEPVRCAAKTRKGTSCKIYAMPNGRCRLHGGLSTGPKTAEGRAKAMTNLKQYRKDNRNHGTILGHYPLKNGHF